MGRAYLAMVLSFPLVLALLGLMALAMAWGFAGPPAARQRAGLTILLFGLGLLAFPLSMGMLVVGHAPGATLLGMALGVCLLATGAHFLRAPEPGHPGGGPGGPGDDGGGGPDGPGGPPMDWDAFDREREQWNRPLAGSR